MRLGINRQLRWWSVKKMVRCDAYKFLFGVNGLLKRALLDERRKLHQRPSNYDPALLGCTSEQKCSRRESRTVEESKEEDAGSLVMTLRFIEMTLVWRLKNQGS